MYFEHYYGIRCSLQIFSLPYKHTLETSLAQLKDTTSYILKLHLQFRIFHVHKQTLCVFHIFSSFFTNTHIHTRYRSPFCKWNVLVTCTKLVQWEVKTSHDIYCHIWYVMRTMYHDAFHYQTFILFRSTSLSNQAVSKWIFDDLAFLFFYINFSTL